MLSDSSLMEMWKCAVALDPSLRITNSQLPGLKRKWVRPQAYSREKMFLNMAHRKVGIFKGVPVLVRKFEGADTRETLIHSLMRKIPPRETSRVQVGPSHVMTRLPVREILRRWLGERAIVGVTDLHIRGTRFEKVIDTKALSDFNTLIRGTEDLARQEMMTLVIASAGNVTDSHSDDPDGTNHCFFGKKLWLAWDTFEGMAAGLQDVERQSVYKKARFDMTRFLGLKSSRWFVVSEGETLFLPGNLTHKVLTLESYLGVGSFHIGLPGSLDSFTRWIHRGPLWSMDDPRRENAGLVDEAARATLRIAKRARSGQRQAMSRWGFPFMRPAYEKWRKSVSAEVRKSVLENAVFLEIVQIAKASPGHA